MGEYLKNILKLDFHLKWKQLVLNVRIKLKIGLKTKLPNENYPTLV
jgi:hypothetical protein